MTDSRRSAGCSASISATAGNSHVGARHIALFTSGGVIAAALCAALQLSPETTVGMSWHLRNASVTRLHYQDGSWSMVSCNETGHLEHLGRPELLTLL